ncbi:hypothetical protein JW877_09035 [bacterium]|nr:hypothetical protein [bacterium]
MGKKFLLIMVIVGFCANICLAERCNILIYTTGGMYAGDRFDSLKAVLEDMGNTVRLEDRTSISDLSSLLPGDYSQCWFINGDTNRAVSLNTEERDSIILFAESGGGLVILADHVSGLASYHADANFICQEWLLQFSGNRNHSFGGSHTCNPYILFSDHPISESITTLFTTISEAEIHFSGLDTDCHPIAIYAEDTLQCSFEMDDAKIFLDGCFERYLDEFIHECGGDSLVRNISCWLEPHGCGCEELYVSSIDYLWFWEETDCNDSNIVHICYLLSGDTSNITISLSSDGGLTWEVPLFTLLDTVGDLGSEVAPGEHCFQWLMNEDLPDSEGMNWMLEIATGYSRGSCSDSVLYILADSFYIGYREGQDLAHTDSTMLLVANPYSSIISIYEFSKCTSALLRSAEIPVAASSPHQGITYAFGFIWVTGHDGVIYKVDHSTLMVEGRYALDRSGLAGSPYYEGLTYDDSLLYVIEDWSAVGGASMIFGFDPDSALSCSVALLPRAIDIDVPDYNYEGFTMAGGVFWCTCPGDHSIKGIDLSGAVVEDYPAPGPLTNGAAWDGCYLFLSDRNSPWVFIYGDGARLWEWLCPSSLRANANLDSRPPEINLFCPEGTFVEGDTIIFDWSVSDSFWVNEPCSLHIYGSGRDLHFEVSDTYFIWESSFACSSCTVVVAARDSFCNWGYDSCVVIIEPAVTSPRIDSLWFWEETECDDTNRVHICYHLSGGISDVYIEASTNGGMTWDVPLETLEDTTGDIGSDILTGYHCFTWILSEDLPNWEGELLLSICAPIGDSIEYFYDFEDGTYSDFEEYVPGRFFVVDDEAYTGSLSVYCAHTTGGDHDRIIHFDHRFSKGRITCWFKCMGPSADGDLYINYDTSAMSGYRCSYRPRYTDDHDFFVASLVDGRPDEYLLWHDPIHVDRYEWFKGEMVRDDDWIYINVYDSFNVLVDEDSIRDCRYCTYCPGQATGVGLFNGGYLDDVLIKFIPLDTIGISNYIDSYPPRVFVRCPVESMSPGDTVEISWHVDDLFWANDPCSLHIYGSGRDLHFEVSDTYFIWESSFACSSCTVVVAARDSFCNWGYDSCVVIIEPAVTSPRIDSLWFWEETECDRINIVNICYILSGDSADISFRMSADSGLTWSVPLDSLINMENDLGWVDTGVHCFEWVISSDLPDTETCRFTVEIISRSTMVGELSNSSFDDFSEGDTTSNVKIMSPDPDGTDDGALWIPPGEDTIKVLQIEAGGPYYTPCIPEAIYAYMLEGDPPLSIKIYQINISAFNASAVSPSSMLEVSYVDYSGLLSPPESISLASFDLLIFGTRDCYGHYDLTLSSADAVRSVVIGGSGLMLTHDTATPHAPCGDHSNFCSLYDITGITCDPDIPTDDWEGFTSVIRVVETDLPILNTPFDIPDTFDVMLTHWLGQGVSAGWILYTGLDAPYSAFDNGLYWQAYHNPLYNSFSTFFSYGHRPLVPEEWESKAMINSLFFSLNGGIGTGVYNSPVYEYCEGTSIDTVVWSLTVPPCGGELNIQIAVDTSIGITESWTDWIPVITAIHDLPAFDQLRYRVGITVQPGCESPILHWIRFRLTEPDYSSYHYTGCLDSRSPEVVLRCPESLFLERDMIIFDWSVSDSFWVNDPCSLHIFGCGTELHTEVSDTYFIWESSFACSSCTVVVAARDSFCNWGYDSCIINIEASVPITASIIEPLPNTWTSCADQFIGIVLHPGSIMGWICEGETLNSRGELPAALIIGTWDGDTTPFRGEISPSPGDSYGGRTWLTQEANYCTTYCYFTCGISPAAVWPEEYATAYMHFYICSPDNREAVLYIDEHDNALTIWHNGDSIYYYDRQRLCTEVSVHLEACWNRFLFKVYNTTMTTSAAWNVTWAFWDSTGSPMTDLRYILEVPDTSYRSHCPIDPGSIDLTLNGEHFSVGDGYLDLVEDTILSWIPMIPDFFEDGDTVEACLLYAGDSCGGTLEAPLCWNFWVDLSAPLITDILPLPGSTIEDTSPFIGFRIVDPLSGADTSSMQMTVDGCPVSPFFSWSGTDWEAGWEAAGPFIPGDSVLVCITITDSTDYCEDNRLDSCWVFYIQDTWPEMNASIIEPLPNTWTSCADQAIIMHLFEGEGGCTGALITEDGEIPEVLILGPFDSSEEPLTDAGLSEIRPSEGDTTLGYAWFAENPYHFSSDYHCDLPYIGFDFYDLGTEWSSIHGSCYILFYLCTPEERDICMAWCIDDDIMIWLNGSLIYSDRDGSAEYDYTCDFHLTPGYNTVLLWASNSGGLRAWDFKWHFEDSLGESITDLYYSITSPASGALSCPIDPSSILFTVESLLYSVGDGFLSFSDDSVLTWIPILPDTFHNGDTITACLVAADDSCGGTIPDLPICWNFYVDLTPPAVFNIYPPPDTTLFYYLTEWTFYLVDSLSGLNTASLTLNANGIEIDPWMEWREEGLWISWNPDSEMLFTDSVAVCLSLSDTTDYCPDNWLDTCWSIYLENPCSLFLALPETLAYPGDTLIIPLFYSTVGAFSTDNFQCIIQFREEIIQILTLEFEDSRMDDWTMVDFDTSISGFLTISGSGDFIPEDSILCWIKLLIRFTASEGCYTELSFGSIDLFDRDCYLTWENGFISLLIREREWLFDLVFRSIQFRNSTILTMGMNSFGSEAYDSGLDIIYLPVPSSPPTWFTLDDSSAPHITKLSRDIRNVSEVPQIWTVHTTDYEGDLSWIPELLPPGDFLINELVDMRANDEYHYEAFEVLTIEYDRPELGRYTFSLEEGWNMISFPVIPTCGDWYDWFPEMLGAAYYYDPESRCYGTATLPERGKGYWVYLRSDTIIEIVGYLIDSYNLEIAEGWNIIGGTTDTVIADYIGYDPPVIIITPLYFYSMGYYLDSYELIPTKAYWLFSMGNSLISVSAP